MLYEHCLGQRASCCVLLLNKVCDLSVSRRGVKHYRIMMRHSCDLCWTVKRTQREERELTTEPVGQLNVWSLSVLWWGTRGEAEVCALLNWRVTSCRLCVRFGSSDTSVVSPVSILVILSFGLSFLFELTDPISQDSCLWSSFCAGRVDPMTALYPVTSFIYSLCF